MSCSEQPLVGSGGAPRGGLRAYHTNPSLLATSETSTEQCDKCNGAGSRYGSLILALYFSVAILAVLSECQGPSKPTLSKMTLTVGAPFGPTIKYSEPHPQPKVPTRMFPPPKAGTTPASTLAPSNVETGFNTQDKRLSGQSIEFSATRDLPQSPVESKDASNGTGVLSPLAGLGGILVMVGALLTRNQMKKQERMGMAALTMKPKGTESDSGSEVDLETAAEIGLDSIQGGETILLDVQGMKCGGCSGAVTRVLLARPEVKDANVNLVTGVAAIQLNEGLGEEAVTAVAEAVTAKGFKAEVRGQDVPLMAIGKAGHEEDVSQLILAWGLVLLCGFHHVGHMLHGLGMHEYAHTAFMDVLGSPVVTACLGAAALLGPGRGLIMDGFKMLFSGSPNMNSLISLGATTSFAGGALTAVSEGLRSESFLQEPVMLLAVVMLGQSLERRARGRAATDLGALAAMIPPSTRLVLDDGTRTMDISSAMIRVGDIVRVLPGEGIPVDGEVVSEGRAVADESMLTGEAALVPKRKGSQVTGGTVIFEGPLDVRATATGTDSALAGIGRLVSDAQARQAPVARIADAVAGKFCYGVMAASALTIAFWAFLGPILFPETISAATEVSTPSALLALKLGIDVLVVACPCALGLATPTAVLVASSAGARRGLLVRGGDVLERLATVDTIVLDKTGTLTEGKMRLDSSTGDRERTLQLAASVEKTTKHPVADAVIEAAVQQGINVLPATGSVTIPGRGVVATVDGRRVAVGSKSWAAEQVGSPIGIDLSLDPDASQTHNGGLAMTRVYVAEEGMGIVGSLDFVDTLRDDAASSVKRLKDMGIRVMLMSGDQPQAVLNAAKECGVAQSDAIGGMTPADKASAVADLKANGATVGMVGDGVNDAPALASADVGIAMQGGTQATAEVAGVVLMGNRLGQVVEAVGLGTATISKINQNLIWALSYNAIGIPIAAGLLLPHFGFALSPSMAGGMMAFSSIAVVSNSLLLRSPSIKTSES